LDGVAVRDAGFRRRLFEETGSRMNLDPLIVEKDFWVCWTLKCLFSLSDMRENLVFKGGTSLSKVYKVIHRFSEDIDLTVNRVLLGFERDNDLANIKSNKQRDRSIGQMVAACSRFVDSDLRQKLDEIFVSYLKDGKEQWSLVIDEQDRDGQTLLFNYPGAVDLVSGSYVDPYVKLEFGCRSDPWPTMSAVVKPYAAKYFPDVFSKNQECEVIALKAERTFWEKATILHQEANRSKDRPFPLRFSRHYYDLAMLAHSPFRDNALQNYDLLEAVAHHKKLFFRCGWAKYDDARPGSLRLLPPDFRLPELQKDYEKMQIMMFEKSPSFQEILDILLDLESTINSR
jgi:hypothetical protein